MAPQDLKLIVLSNSTEGNSTEFKQSVTIHTIVKEHSVFIQTDKAVYKLDDKVKFRVFVLDAATKPYYYQNLTILIDDPYQTTLYNKTVHFENPFNFEPVFESDFTISANSFFGDWSLKVYVDNDASPTSKTFEVKEYVLPLFEVFLVTKKHLSEFDKSIRLSIHAKYNFGENVEGTANISFKLYEITNPNEMILEHIENLEGINEPKSISVDLSSQLQIRQLTRDYIIKVEAVFEEKLTKKKAEKNETISLKYQLEYKIEVLRSRRYLKPGFPYELKVIVHTPDGELEPGKALVTIEANLALQLPRCSTKAKIGAKMDDAKKIFLDKQLNNSIAEFSFDIPSNASSLTLKINYDGVIKTEKIVRQPSKCREYLKAEIVSERFVIKF